MVETKICAILNYTDNSFSDGNKYSNKHEVVKGYNEMLALGADIVDIGAQSTAYDRFQESAEKEWGKLLPVLELLPSLKKVSIDTYNYTTAAKAVEFGVAYINDVSGGVDPKMLALVAGNPKLKYIGMFSLCVPANRHIRIHNIQEIYSWCESSVKKFTNLGIRENQIILDPGIGFATNAEQSYQVIKNCEVLSKYGVEVMIGHSRKSFFEHLTHLPSQERDLETVVASLRMYGKVDYLRVHNPEMHTRAFKIWKHLIDQGR